MDEAGFRLWLSERQEHREAFDLAERAWKLAGGVAPEIERKAARSKAHR